MCVDKSEDEVVAIKQMLEECNPEARLADGFDDALIGVGRQFSRYLAVYDYELCAQVLMEQGLSYEEAVEHLEFNVVGAWVGDGTPVFLHRPDRLTNHLTDAVN
jgi:hypothetical protein